MVSNAGLGFLQLFWGVAVMGCPLGLRVLIDVMAIVVGLWRG